MHVTSPYLVLLLAAAFAGAQTGDPAAAEAAAGARVFAAAVPPWCATQPRRQYAALERMPVASTWFQVYRVDPGVYAIYEPHQWQEVISYLIIGKDRALLFDTGMGIGDIRSVTSELTHLPVEVLNSHTHIDHIGDNWEFDHVLGLNTEFTQRNARGSPHAAVAGEVAPDHLCGALPAGFDTATYRTRPFRITQTVADSSIIPLGGRQLEVLQVPGHAPDAIALLDTARGELFTGDTFYAGPIYVFGPGADFKAFTASVDRLATLVPRLHKLLPAHNVPVAAPALLLRLRDAVHAVASGAAHGTPEGGPGLVTYKFSGFSLVLPRGT